MTRSGVLRPVLLLAITLAALIVASLAGLVALTLTAPVTSVPVPSSCTGAASRLPTDRSVPVPGVGMGTLLASDGTTSVVVVPDQGRSPRGGTAYLLGTTDRVVRGLRLTSDAVVAAVDDGIVVLFDDKIGYLFRGSDGRQLRYLFESDNYRGLYASGATRYLRLTAAITAVGLEGSLAWRRDVAFAGIADGCFFPAPTR